MKAFVLGTGPSLAKVDLDKLVGQYTIACNRIQTEYERTKWRPDTWLQTDESRNRFIGEDIIFHLEQGYRCVVAHDLLLEQFPAIKNRSERMASRKAWFEYPNVEFLLECGHYHADYNPAVEWHLPHLCTFGGPVHVGIQMAVKDGASDIFLLGCDLGYKPRSVNHCSPDYLPLESYPNEASADLRNRTLELAHRVAAKECKDRGVNLWNATPGGHLEVHPRIDLSKVV